MMNKIIVGSDKKSTVFIGNKFLWDIGFYIPTQHSNSKIAIVTDDIVAKIHLNTVISSLEKYGFNPVIFVMPHGKENKNPTMLAQIIKFFSINMITKSDLVIALGGGTVHDLTGYASAIYNQGINFISIPTTFSCMINNSIGGCVYLNTPYRINQIGMLHFPVSVFIDIDTLSTTPTYQQNIISPQAVKYGFIFDKRVLSVQLSTTEPELLLNYITQLIRIKNNILFINSTIINPLILDFGTTIGEIIETHSNYKVSTDEAMAIGMAMMTRLSEQKQLTRSGTYQMLSERLKKINYQIHYQLPNDYFMKMIMSDKKFDGDVLNIVILKEIQKPQIHKINRKEIPNFFEDLF